MTYIALHLIILSSKYYCLYNGGSWINERMNRTDEMRNETMTEFRIVEIIARRFENGREECQVQSAVTWEIVDEAFAKQQLYREFIEDLKEDEKAAGNIKNSICNQNSLTIRQELTRRRKEKQAKKAKASLINMKISFFRPAFFSWSQNFREEVRTYGHEILFSLSSRQR